MSRVFLYVVCLGWIFLFSVIQMQRIYAIVRVKGTKIAWLGLDRHRGLAKNTCFARQEMGQIPGNDSQFWSPQKPLEVSTALLTNTLGLMHQKLMEMSPGVLKLSNSSHPFGSLVDLLKHHHHPLHLLLLQVARMNLWFAEASTANMISWRLDWRILMCMLSVCH